MTELQRHLQDGDPLLRESTLAREDVDRMRRIVLTAAHQDRRRVSVTALALLAGLSGAAAVGVWTVGEAPRGRATSAPLPVTLRTTEVQPPAAEHRQLHFSTQGGTRVIWVFNSQFQER